MQELEREIHKLAGHPFNIGSPKQLGEVLFDELASSRRQEDEDRRLRDRCRACWRSWRSPTTCRRACSTGANCPSSKAPMPMRWSSEINPKTGRVHTCFSLAGAATGRLSSTDPNLQNIPIRTEEGRKIRRAFVAEPGHLLISADYSQIELRLAAHVAGIDALKEAFRAGADIHAHDRERSLRRADRRRWTPRSRRRAKAINFGIIYGISAFGLGQQLGVPQGEAADYIKRYFRALPRHPRLYGAHARQLAREHGYVETLFGRRVHIPGIKDANPAAARLFRTRGDQRAAPRLGRRHHQARDAADSAGACRPPD